MRKLLSALPSAACLLFTLTIPAQTLTRDPAAEEMLNKARTLSDLRGPNVPSFHLTATLETLDYKGATEGTAQLDVLALKNGPSRQTLTFQGKQGSVYSKDGKTYRKADEGFLRTFAQDRAIRMLLSPIPETATLEQAALSQRKVKFGSLEFNCVVVGLPYPSESNRAASAPNAAYCIDPSLGIARTVEGHNNQSTTLNTIVKMGPVYLAKDISVMERGVRRAVLHVTSLEVIHGETVDLQLPDAAPTSDTGQSIGPSVMAGKKISGGSPIYPAEAKSRHIQGMVVLHAIIGRDGAIRDLEVVSTPDDSLIDSSLDAVRTWRYTPYLLDGKPVEVDTTIRVYYSFAR